ncbi:unnamed protein product, partial [Vitis vinifera]|uniref:Uncharacterized protein n=1 Tax=Vitis vinifera TaxID=29760 RepID=E0CTN9_VITVI
MPSQDGVPIGGSNLGLKRKKINPLWWKSISLFLWRAVSLDPNDK